VTTGKIIGLRRVFSYTKLLSESRTLPTSYAGAGLCTSTLEQDDSHPPPGLVVQPAPVAVGLQKAARDEIRTAQQLTRFTIQRHADEQHAVGRQAAAIAQHHVGPFADAQPAPQHRAAWDRFLTLGAVLAERDDVANLGHEDVLAAHARLD